MEINIRLDRNFTTAYNRMQNDYGTEIAKINGFDDAQLSYTDFIDNFIDEDTVADSSIDSSSNVAHKDIVTLEREMPKPHEKLLAFNKIFYEMNKRFGFKAANEWLKAEWVGQLYMHDASSSTFKSYCFAYDLKDLAERGLFFLEGQNKEPAHHLTTFVDFLKEYINYVCNRSAGATGLPNLLPYMFYFWKKDVEEDYLGIRSSHNEEYYARQNFQRFIYAVNQKYMRDGSQSSFTNTAIFDRPYFEALFGGSEFPDGTFMIDYEEDIIEFQKLFMEVMSEIHSVDMFTFPVNTISLLRQDGKFVDEDFAKWAIAHNMKWSDSNIFVDDSINSLSNCCFDGSQETLIKVDDRVYRLSFKELYEKQYENFKIFNNGMWADGKVVRLPRRPLYKITTSNGKSIIVTDNHINVTLRGDIPTAQLRTHDFLKFSNWKVNRDGEVEKICEQTVFFRIDFIERYVSDDNYVYCFEMDNIYEPYFTLSNGIVTHNCRLKSNIKDLGYFNSIGGTALKVGSVKVSTINLARIALDTDTEEEYLAELGKRVWLDLQALDCVRHIIKRNVDKGLLPNFSYGLIDFDHLYNTIGFIGIYETMKKFGYITVDEFGNTFYTEQASEFGNKIFQTMRKTADEFIEVYNCNYMINTEQIPGESAAAKLMQKDKFFYPNANVYDLPLYGNQFIPLGIKTTGQERIRIQAEFDGYCNGGSILHYNIDAPFDSFEKAWKMTNYIADQGVTYFAFNTKIQVCEDNHAFYGTTCPICGKPVESEYTRIVGFFVNIKTYSRERKAEYKMRRWHPINSEVGSYAT